MSKKGCIFALIFFVIILLILVICGAICVVFASAVKEYDASYVAPEEDVIIDGGDNKVAVIEVEGVIAGTDDAGGLFGDTYAGADTIIANLDRANDDETR